MKHATKTKKKPRPARAKSNGHAITSVRGKKKRRKIKDSLFSDWGTFTDSGPADLSQNLDKYLTDIAVAEHEQEQRR